MPYKIGSTFWFCFGCSEPTSYGFFKNIQHLHTASNIWSVYCYWGVCCVIDFFQMEFDVCTHCTSEWFNYHTIEITHWCVNTVNMKTLLPSQLYLGEERSIDNVSLKGKLKGRARTCRSDKIINQFKDDGLLSFYVPLPIDFYNYSSISHLSP